MLSTLARAHAISLRRNDSFRHIRRYFGRGRVGSAPAFFLPFLPSFFPPFFCGNLTERIFLERALLLVIPSIGRTIHFDRRESVHVYTALSFSLSLSRWHVSPIFLRSADSSLLPRPRIHTENRGWGSARNNRARARADLRGALRRARPQVTPDIIIIIHTAQHHTAELHLIIAESTGGARSARAEHFRRFRRENEIT